MKVLTVRLDDDLHARAVKAAGQDARSLNGELNWLLRAALDARTTQANHGSDEKDAAAVVRSRQPSKPVVGYSKEQQTRGKR